MAACDEPTQFLLGADLAERLCVSRSTMWSDWWVWGGIALLLIAMVAGILWFARDLGRMIGEDLYESRKLKREQQELESAERQEIIRLLRQTKGRA